MALDNKRKLKNIDDMIESFGGVNESENPQRSLNITTLVPFSNHPFSLYEGERLDDMVASIKTNGVLVPIIVRKNGNESLYEILSGHNRVNAGRLAGLTEVPAILLEDVSDDLAMIYVMETNLMQRSFSDMKHSEKAAVIAMHHSKMFSQGKRSDILEMLSRIENNEDLTFSQSGKKLRSHETIGGLYSLCKNTVARYIRINKLSDPLKKRLDNNDIGFIPAVALSYLTDTEQAMVDTYLNADKIKIDIKKAEKLRRHSKDGILDEAMLVMILENTDPAEQPSKTPLGVKIRRTVLDKYFKAEDTPKMIEDKIELALELYFNQNPINPA